MPSTCTALAAVVTGRSVGRGGKLPLGCDRFVADSLQFGSRAAGVSTAQHAVCLTGRPRSAKLAPSAAGESHASHARDGHCTTGQSIPRGGTRGARARASRGSNSRARLRRVSQRLDGRAGPHAGTRVSAHSGARGDRGYRCDRCGYRWLAGRHACRGRLAQRCLRPLRPLSARKVVTAPFASIFKMRLLAISLKNTLPVASVANATP